MSDSHSRPTQADITAAFDYNQETGNFYAKAAYQKYPAGRRVGRPHRLGYEQIRFKGAHYYAHRLAWLYVHGDWPNGEMDHINGIRNDNRIANLRVVTRAVNMQNIRSKKHRKNATSEYLGVSFERRMKSRPWRAVVNKDGKNYDCGYWATEEEAHAAYVAKKRELHEGCTL